MKILQRYILAGLIKNFSIGLGAFTFLFLVFDFFDRIDNILAENTNVLTVILYFIYKVPFMVNLMLPVGVMFATLFTFGLLSKNSEITAMRASGATVWWLARPLLIFAAFLSVGSIILDEFVVPVSERRQKELYNIDIRQKDKKGGYSHSDFWWRDENHFYSVNTFDSRTKTLLDLSMFERGPNWQPDRRTDANKVTWIDPIIGWSMRDIDEHRFVGLHVESNHIDSLPLPISEQPQDFYDFKTDPNSMSFSELKKFIRDQAGNGLPTAQYMADLYSKLSFPFIIVIVALVVLPFSLRPARSGSMAYSSIAAITIAFAYYAVDSFSLAMGRAEIVPPFLAAWMANLVMGAVGIILNLGAEAPH